LLAAAHLLLVLPAAPALASDGVIEINQVKALAGEVTPGDTPGFPVILTEPGSYILTGNLTVPDENTIGIDFAAKGISLDLNGFSVLGPTVCTTTEGMGSTISCSPTGTGIGVRLARTKARVHGGFVSGHGDRGIGSFGDHGEFRIEDLVVSSNGQVGVFIDASPNSTVRNVTSTMNGAAGILVSAGSMVVACESSSNGGDGIFAPTASSLVRDSVARLNGGFGLSGGAPYVGNVIDGNTAGTVAGGFQMGINACDGNTTCP
jgi:hypothetical protein